MIKYCVNQMQLVVQAIMNFSYTIFLLHAKNGNKCQVWQAFLWWFCNFGKIR